MSITNHSSSYFGHLASNFVSSHVEEGFAKIFNFHVLRHGTALPYYFSIIENGADPSQGGKSTENLFLRTDIPLEAGEKKQTIENCQGHFFVFKDVLAFESVDKFLAIISDVFLTRCHAVFAAQAYAQEHMPDNKLYVIAQVIEALFTPRIRFMYREQEINDLFCEDPDYKPLALFTEHALPSERIGLTGIIKHATKEDFEHTPLLQKIYGIFQIILGVILTLCCLGLVT